MTPTRIQAMVQRGDEISERSMKGLDFRGFDLSGGIFSSCDFSGADLSRARRSKAACSTSAALPMRTSPRPGWSNASSMPVRGAPVRAWTMAQVLDGDVRELHLSGVDFSGADAAMRAFDHDVLDDASFADVLPGKAQRSITACTLLRADFSARAAEARHVLPDRPAHGGVRRLQLRQDHLHRVQARRGRPFAASRFENCQFTDADLSDCDFEEARRSCAATSRARCSKAATCGACRRRSASFRSSAHEGRGVHGWGIHPEHLDRCRPGKAPTSRRRSRAMHVPPRALRRGQLRRIDADVRRFFVRRPARRRLRRRYAHAHQDAPRADSKARGFPIAAACCRTIPIFSRPRNSPAPPSLDP
jgi:uncharacterized protein YjbI with pentapeptide repeats